MPPVISLTFSRSQFLLNASNKAPILLSDGIASHFSRISSLSGVEARSSMVSPPEASAMVKGLGWGAPYSKLDHAFRKASSKRLPIAITSPVDFIEVPMVLSAVLNLSKGHLGILTTQ